MVRIHREPPIEGLRRELVAWTHCGARFARQHVGDWQRWPMHSILNRDQAGSIPASPTIPIAGLADMDMHSPFKRDEAGSIPASRTKTGDSSNGTGSCLLSMERRFEPGIPFQCGSVVQWERTPGYEPGHWVLNPLTAPPSPHRSTGWVVTSNNRVASEATNPGLSPGPPTTFSVDGFLEGCNSGSEI